MEIVREPFQALCWVNVVKHPFPDAPSQPKSYILHFYRQTRIHISLKGRLHKILFYRGPYRGLHVGLGKERLKP